MAGQPVALRTVDDTVLLVGRIALGTIFALNGLEQLMTFGAFATSLANRGLPLPSMWAILALSAELTGGILIICGLRTRPASLLIILFLIVATLLSHRYWELAESGRRGQEIQFFKNISIAGGLLILFVTGPGRFSLDRALRRT